MKYTVRTIREAGLEARWTRTRKGKPIIVARVPGNETGTWYAVSDKVWKRAKLAGIYQAFEECTVLGRYFSIPL